jgi:hypothetical protein
MSSLFEKTPYSIWTIRIPDRNIVPCHLSGIPLQKGFFHFRKGIFTS